MNSQEKIYQNLAQSLANLFSPMAEVSLFDKNNHQLAVFNRITHGTPTRTEPYKVSKLILNQKQQAKSLSIPLENGYYLHFIVETSLFEGLQTLLTNYLSKSLQAAEIPDWQNLVDRSIHEYLQLNDTSLTALTTQEKRSLVHDIQQKNLLRYQEATSYLANKLQVSRATIYNYLKQARK